MIASEEVLELCEAYDDANYDVLKAYLEEHPEVMVDLYRDEDGENALHMTSYHRSPKSAELLLDHKANINARDSGGDTSVNLACVRPGNEDSALVLIERGANIHLENNYDHDALHFCLCNGSLSLAFTLLCCGSDIEEVKTNYIAT
jgi:ankyrin repeat protein